MIQKYDPKAIHDLRDAKKAVALKEQEASHIEKEIAVYQAAYDNDLKMYQRVALEVLLFDMWHLLGYRYQLL